jgi:hypothetical protein
MRVTFLSKIYGYFPFQSVPYNTKKNIASFDAA